MRKNDFIGDDNINWSIHARKQATPTNDSRNGMVFRRVEKK